MSDTTASLRRKISSAGDLQSVVRTMKALAASSISQYEQSEHALGDYYRTVELGLSLCFRDIGSTASMPGEIRRTEGGTISAVVFGSDQGLVGQFNDVVADYALKTLAALPGKPQVWAVGEPVHAHLADAGLPLTGLFTMPNYTSFTRAPRPERYMCPSVSDCYRWTKTGAASWPNVPGRRETCPRSWVAAPRPCGRSSANIFSSRSSERAPNPF
jgi:hypothetical protein